MLRLAFADPWGSGDAGQHRLSARRVPLKTRAFLDFLVQELSA